MKGLHVDFHARNRVVKAVSGVSFDVSDGEIVAIVGESGSGKSATALSLLGLTKEAGASLKGSVLFAPPDVMSLPDRAAPLAARARTDVTSLAHRAAPLGARAPTDMLSASPKQLQALRGDLVSIVFQDPLSSLNPVQRIGAQVVEQVRAHKRIGRSEARDVARRAFERSGLRGAHFASAYPHELSGGQRQRAMIAIAISCDPVLLVADEPTTALDVTTQAEILAELARLRAESGMSIVLVTHDLAVVSGIADRVLVMSAGKIVEEGRTEEIFHSPQSGEAQLLLRSIVGLYGRAWEAPADAERPGEGAPRIEGEPGVGIEGEPGVGIEGEPGVGIEGEPGVGIEGEPGVEDELRIEAAPRVEGAHRIEAAPRVEGAHRIEGERVHVGNGVSGELRMRGAVRDAPLLQLLDLSVTYPPRDGGGPVSALRGVSVEVDAGETLGIVGESGCGKSTLLRCASRLLDVEGGMIRFDGSDVTHVSRRALRPLRRGVQMVFQDPDASLNPRHTVEKILQTPLRLRGIRRSEVASEVASLLREVGLDAEHAKRFPHELSGGQRQRVGIARALAMEPRLLLLDEPVSSLDVSVRAQIVKLLQSLKRRRRLACVFVAHDIALVAKVSDRIAVMHDGEIVECGPAKDVYMRPSHEYTQTLLAAVPLPSGAIARSEVAVEVER